MTATTPRPSAPPLPDAVRARNHRVEEYRTIVRPIALHYAGLCREQVEDLEQVGLMGLIRAAELYRSERSIPFGAFARPHIRGAILHYLRDGAPILRLPRRQQELADRVRRARVRLGQELGRSPLEEELRLDLGLSAAQWQRYEQALRMARVDSLDADPEIPAPAEPGPVAENEPCALLVMECLEPRQVRVVRAVVLQGASLRQVARELEVSPMTAHRLLRKGLDRLRQLLGEEAGRFSPAPSAAPAC